jgi:cold shock CspA family protein
VETIHGNRSQSQRERALAAFAEGAVDALLATDVAARGIHIDNVGCVLHFDPPADEKDYTHRSGRTARAGASGTVISLVTPEQEKAVSQVQRTLQRAVGFSTPGPFSPADAATPDRLRRAPEPPPRRRRAPAAPVATAAHDLRGRIKFFDTRRGFGFIELAGNEDVFVHHSALEVSGHRLREGQAVEFEIGPGRRGDEARRVRLVAA